MEPDTSLRKKKLDADTGWGALVIVTLALVVSYLSQETELLPPMWLTAGLGGVFIGACLAVLARLLFARDAKVVLRDSALLVHWIGSRLAFFAAAWVLLIGWLITLPIGRPWSTVAGRSLIFVLIFSVVNSLIGQAVINSAILIGRFRRLH